MLAAPVAFAQAPADPALLTQGAQLYETNCRRCHQPTGAGIPPTFPALAGNDRLTDTALIVDNIHNGKGAMRAFPNLSAEQIAAVATYVRNAWSNRFGGVATAEVTALLDKSASLAPTISVWSGVYTSAQAERGAAVHSAVCSRCHGLNLDGAGQADMPVSPAIARGAFIRSWTQDTLAGLFEYVSAAMPPGAPGSLSAQQYIDAVAHMLASSNMPAGMTELPPDRQALSRILIGPRPQ
jgi:mono/diheme cytochrome c family protein